jgi:hypothetical protein
MPFSIKKCLPHILVAVGFIIISLAYFNPVLKGKKIFQSDIMHYIGMSKQQNDFRTETGEETYWTNSAFGGMPTYQLGAKYPHNYIKQLDLALRFLPRPADYLFLYFFGFYVLLLVMKVDFKLAVLGALAFGFSTYLIIILGVGHNSKAHAIAYMPLVFSGILLVFKRRYIIGFLVTVIAMGLELVANHFQMTYYLMLLVIVMGVVYLIDTYKKGDLLHFFKSVGILVLAVVLAVGLNATNVLATQEYASESTRSQSELTINADGSPKELTTGLDRDYITEYSYGILETFNLYIPRFMGGGSYEDVGKDSASYEFFLSIGASPLQALEQTKQIPTYWGEQTIVEAPAYIGAIVIFLFVLALFLVKGRLKWWLVSGTVLSLLLSYGKHLGFFTDIFIDYVPLYNKFRAVSSIQVILELCVPVLAVFGLVRLFNDFDNKEKKLKALKFTVIITAGLALVFLLLKSSLFNFVGGNDGFYRQNYGPQFVDAVIKDRKMFFTQDTIRTLVLVLLASGAVFLYLKEKLSQTKVILIFGVLILFDLVGVDRRYVNNDNFVSALKVNKPYEATEVDLQIQKDREHFRVLDVTSGGARAAYFHNSLSGYHAAKLKRYNELYDFHIAKNNLNVLSMLNTKYIIAEDEEGNKFPFTNTETNGNAWYVQELRKVSSANEEIQLLDSLDTKRIAITSITDLSNKTFTIDSSATISVETYKPNNIVYKSSSNIDGFAVFSEVFYDKGWNAYLDGTLVPHTRVNYVLRAMQVPAGEHTIEFKFEPKVIQTGSRIALASSVMLALLIIGGLVYCLKANKKQGA